MASSTEHVAGREWLEAEGGRLLEFARGSRVPAGGFGWLDADGRLDAARPVETWITARMTYVFGLAHLRGDGGAAELVDHGVAALSGMLRDPEHGGWFVSDPAADVVDEKRAYDHAFVTLAAATAVAAGRPGAARLLADALACVDEHFWDDEVGLSVDVWDRAWTALDPYRGANANMHLTEAFLAVADVTGDDRWRRRACRIAERLVHGEARALGWRLPEHFDSDWRRQPDYNRDEPRHPFRPYGATVGHWFEWARLLTHLHLAHDDPPAWLLQDARALFDAGVTQGWAADGAPGFPYTVDWDGTPVVRERMHWVVAEAIGAATVLHQVTGHEDYARWEATWWQYARQHLVDTQRGSWHHELDLGNAPAATVWEGKPDVYHAYQAVLLCLTPSAASLVSALRAEERS